MDAVLADGSVDAVIAIYVPPVRVDEVDVARAIWEIARKHSKPVLCNFLGRAQDSAGFVELVTHGVPSYSYPESAARALAAMRRYARYRDRDEGDLRTFPVDRGGKEDLVEGASRLARRLRDRGVTIEGFLVQEFVTGGTEVLLGMTRDKVYGPCLVFGLGGIYVEYLKDVAFGLPPLTDRDAMRMIESIRTYPLLKGVRGESARDVKALQDALLRLAQLVSDSDQIQEIDLNPLLVLLEGKGYRAVDARIVLAPPAVPT